jgi:hypothetical protein
MEISLARNNTRCITYVQQERPGNSLEYILEVHDVQVLHTLRLYGKAIGARRSREMHTS